MAFTPKHQNLTIGVILTIIAYFFFATSSAFVRIIGEEVSTIEILFFQTFVPLILILPVVFKKGFSTIKPKFFSGHLVRGISGILGYFCYFFAIKKIDLVDATVLTYTAPFYIPILWSIWAKDKMQKEVWWAILLGFIGIIFILKPGTEIFHIGSFIGILAGILSAIALTSIGILNKKEVNTVSILFYYFLISSIIAFPFLFFYWQTPSVFIILLLVGVGLTNFFGQMLLTDAYDYGTASFLSPLSYFIVIFTSLISWIFFYKPPGKLSLIGITFIIIGGTLTTIFKKKPEKVSEIFEKNHHIEKEKFRSKLLKFFKRSKKD